MNGRLGPVAENEKVADRLLTLLDEINGTGKQLHDANVVATDVDTARRRRLKRAVDRLRHRAVGRGARRPEATVEEGFILRRA